MFVYPYLSFPLQMHFPGRGMCLAFPASLRSTGIYEYRDNHRSGMNRTMTVERQSNFSLEKNIEVDI